MRLATIRRDGTTTAVRVEGDDYVVLPAIDVGALLQRGDWDTHAGTRGSGGGSFDEADVAPLVLHPAKIICVGLNYRQHILEMGRDLPEHPTLFAKFARALVGAGDVIELPAGSTQVDWEAELAVVIGREVRDADANTAADAIAGFTVMNDVTARDWQYRTTQWLQGKTFERTSPLGPVLVTPDELPGGVAPQLDVRAELNDDVVQAAGTSDLVFGPVELVAFVSSIVTLEPGDVISTGTPGGVGHARTPPRYLADGDVLVTSISEIGRCENPILRRRPT